MTRFLAYLTPAVGHTLPYVPGLLELQRRGHEVHVRTLPSMAEHLRAAGLQAEPVADDVLTVPVTDYLAKTDADRLKNGQVDLMVRGRYNGPDLDHAIAAVRPEALLVDSIAYGAMARAAASGLPWAMLVPSVLPVPEPGIPPYGLGLPPRPGPLGRVRDAAGWRLVTRMFSKAMMPGFNELRASAGLQPQRSPLEVYDEADAVIALTSAPLEYPRHRMPAHFHLVGTQPWEVPAPRPAYLDEPGDPWVLVTCSTDYQGDQDLARVAVEALRDEPVRVLVTLADAYDETTLPIADNVRVERFVPHGQVLPEASLVVCHGGMGIVTKCVGAGVPMVVVPFGRDQPEIARRVTEAGAGVSLKARRLTPERLRAAVHGAHQLAPSARAARELMDPAGAPGRFADAALTLGRRTDILTIRG
ncbi:glycosyltransferase [Nocardioides panacisoli]|uniref:Glycosyltransferase n=1 Tax=Nocardioides panacisoli TaxID=627624 RepID=A0ABP7IES2_9ACTN